MNNIYYSKYLNVYVYEHHFIDENKYNTLCDDLTYLIELPFYTDTYDFDIDDVGKYIDLISTEIKIDANHLDHIQILMNDSILQNNLVGIIKLWDHIYTHNINYPYIIQNLEHATLEYCKTFIDIDIIYFFLSFDEIDINQTNVLDIILKHNIIYSFGYKAELLIILLDNGVRLNNILDNYINEYQNILYDNYLYKYEEINIDNNLSTKITDTDNNSLVFYINNNTILKFTHIKQKHATINRVKEDGFTMGIHNTVGIVGHQIWIRQECELAELYNCLSDIPMDILNIITEYSTQPNIRYICLYYNTITKFIDYFSSKRGRVWNLDDELGQIGRVLGLCNNYRRYLL